MFKIKVIDTLIGMCTGAALFFPFVGVLSKPPVPYTDVEYEVSKNEAGYIISARFTKTACVFEDLDVLGTGLGYTRPLNWYDTLGDKGNREVGEQEFKLQAETYATLSSIKVVVQHMCSGELVETVFLNEDFKGD